MSGYTTAQVQADFLAALPSIRGDARARLRGLGAEAREEMLAEAIAVSWKWWVRLVERGRDPRAILSGLGRMAARHVLGGRRLVGYLRASRQTSHRVSLAAAQLDRDGQGAVPVAGVGPEPSLDPAELVASRDAYEVWWERLNALQRRVASLLADGCSARSAARLVHRSEARVSQIRREVMLAWRSI